MRRILPILTFCILFFSNHIYSQSINQILVTSELTKRGLTEQEVRSKLLSKGIDVDKLKIDDLPRYRRPIEDAIAELEAEKAQKQRNITAGVDTSTKPNMSAIGSEKTNTDARQLSKSKADEIKEEIAKGASTEEAISKALLSNLKDSVTKIPAYIYGQNIFRDKNLGYFLDKSFKAPDSYILNSGDKVAISISNPRVFFNQTYEIDREGFLKLDNMPRVSLKGVSVERARKVLASNFARFYAFSPEDFQITVAAARVVTVNIVGEVFNPGTHTISAGNSAFNALAAVGGPTNIGSVRNIQLTHTSTGEKKRLDVYAFLFNPGIVKDLYLYENDYIYVPPVGKIVTIDGEIRRPFKYELLDNEHLNKLIEYAGGLTENAYQATIQIKRIIDDKEKYIDVNYRELKAKGGDFNLMKGDFIIIKSISKNLENIALISGAVEQPGEYEITEGMRVSDLLKKAVLKKEARKDIAYLQRQNDDKTHQLKFISIDEVLTNPSTISNYKLQSRDSLIIFVQEKFARKDSVYITGAVKDTSIFAYDVSRSGKVRDFVLLAGGLRYNATDFAYVISSDSSNSKILSYKKINIKEALSNPSSIENVTINPNDTIKVLFKDDFIDDSYIRIAGAVRKPGEYRFANSLTLTDALILANGLRIEAATNKVDIFRIEIKENQPVKTVVATIEVDRDMQIVDPKYKDFQLQPYDNIFVRTVPKFSLQKIVTLTGEVTYPGEYALLEDNESIANIVNRAGGLTLEAFPKGATLFRKQENIGYIAIDLDVALKNIKSNNNIVLKEGDIIDIPKTKDIVSIKGATQAADLYQSKILTNGVVNVAFDGEKSAWYYVDKYAAGVNKEGRRSLIVVEHPNGVVKRTKDFFFFKVYPKVQKGSTITVGYAEAKKDKDKEKKEKTDWGKILSDTIAQTTALLSFILLLQRLQ